MDDLMIIELYFAHNEQANKEADIKYGKLCVSVMNNILSNEEDSEECEHSGREVVYTYTQNGYPPLLRFCPMSACGAPDIRRKFCIFKAFKNKGFIQFRDARKGNLLLFQHVLEGHEDFMPHVECSLVREAKLFRRAVQVLAFQRVADKISPHGTAEMGTAHQRTGRIQESLPASMAEEVLIFLGMAIFDNMCLPAAWAGRSVGQLLVGGNDAQHKADDPLNVRFTKGFDAFKQGSNFIFHVVITSYCI